MSTSSSSSVPDSETEQEGDETQLRGPCDGNESAGSGGDVADSTGDSNSQELPGCEAPLSADTGIVGGARVGTFGNVAASLLMLLSSLCTGVMARGGGGGDNIVHGALSDTADVAKLCSSSSASSSAAAAAAALASAVFNLGGASSTRKRRRESGDISRERLPACDELVDRIECSDGGGAGRRRDDRDEYDAHEIRARTVVAVAVVGGGCWGSLIALPW